MLKTFTFSGSHCVGKTTLINTVSSLSEIARTTKVLTSNSTDLKLLEGVSLETRQVLLVQRELEMLLEIERVKREIHNERDAVILKDRSILDTLIYSKYFVEQGKLSKVIYTQIENASENILSRYDRIFILPVVDSIKFVERDKFSMELESRQRISDLFLEFVTDSKLRNITLLDNGDLTFRADKVLEVIENSFSEEI